MVKSLSREARPSGRHDRERRSIPSILSLSVSFSSHSHRLTRESGNVLVARAVVSVRQTSVWNLAVFTGNGSLARCRSVSRVNARRKRAVPDDDPKGRRGITVIATFFRFDSLPLSCRWYVCRIERLFAGCDETGSGLAFASSSRCVFTGDDPR